MGTDPTPIEPDDHTGHEHWSSPIDEVEEPVDTRPLHPRGDGEDPELEALEMEHRGMSAQR